MFKFFRKYEKWMLVVFCGGLMLAFLVPQAMQQFSPNSVKSTVATLFDGKVKITLEDRQRASSDLNVLAKLGLASPGLVPLAKNDADQALGWMLMVRAGEHAGLSASNQQAFNAIVLARGIKDEDELAKLAQDLGTSEAHLLDVARQYLIAEQYRQLVQGVAFSVDPNSQINSPGLRRINIERDARQQAEGLYQQAATAMEQNNFMLAVQLRQFADQSYQVSLMNMQGRPRIAEPVLQHWFQQRQTKVSGTVAVFDAADYENAVGEPGLAKLQEVFEAYRGDFPGQGSPQDFGYRIPPRVKLEAVRIPIEAVRELVASEITQSDIRDYFMEFRPAYRGWEPIDVDPAEEEVDADADTDIDSNGDDELEPAVEGEEAEAAPGAEGETPEAADDTEAGEDGEVTDEAVDDATDEAEGDEPAEEEVNPLDIPLDQVVLTPQIRAEIRESLIVIKSGERMTEIGRAVAGLFAQDARPLADDGRYKEIPDGFVPTTLAEIAQKVKRDYGIDLEIINDDGRWISLADLPVARETAGVVLTRLPQIVVRGALPGQFGQPAALRELRLPGVGLHGHMGLLSSVVPIENQRPAGLENILRLTRELLSESEQDQALPLRLQVGLGAAVQTIDACESRYVFRVTAVDKDHPAPDFADVRDDVAVDARLLMAYEAMLERKDDHVEVARGAGVAALQPVATYVTGLTQFSRSEPPVVRGVENVAPLVEAVFELADRLRAQGDVIGDNAAPRVIVVELPRERKLLVFQLTEYYPLTRSQFVSNISQPNVLLGVSRNLIGNPAANPMTLESLQRATGFKWKDDEDPEEDGASDGDDS